MAESNNNKLAITFVITLLITVLGWGINLGVCLNKIDQNTKAIEKIDARQNASETMFNNISLQLVELNTKVSLLLDGKLKGDNN